MKMKWKWNEKVKKKKYLMYIHTLLQFAYFVIPLLTAVFYVCDLQGFFNNNGVLESIMYLEYVNMHILPIQDVGG
jgi:hypothetical protein